jgi:energy-coupling factor transporter ATP-binding protein EcfA2
MIKSLRLENFKGVRTGDVGLDKLTVLIGPNNSGKTTILEALFLAPNPFRTIPYVPSTPVGLLSELHKITSPTSYHFLLNNYTAENAKIEYDGKSIVFVKEFGSIKVYTNYKLPSMSRKINEEELFLIGELYTFRAPEIGSGALIGLNSLLFSTKLVGYAHQYLRDRWIEIVNRGVTGVVAKEISRHINEEYVNITIEPFIGGELGFFALLSDGRRVRLSDLGAGAHLYIINRLLYEDYRPDILLWDDIEAHLNPRLLSQVAEWFADLIDEGKQVVVATHSIEAVETVTTYIEDATILFTSLKDGVLRTRRLNSGELRKLAEAGVDPRLAESFLL